MGDDNKECKGCTSHYDSFIYDRNNEEDEHFNFDFVGCDLPPKLGDYFCPCLECIVKMTCQSGCNDYFKYMSDARKERGGEKDFLLYSIRFRTWRDNICY